MENLPARKIDLTMEEVKRYICPEATEQEAYVFLKLCEAQGLNPFLREAYLIKYGTEKATIVTGKDTFTKRADRLPQYDGFKAGIIILSNKQVSYREGSFTVAGETLLGGWAEVFRKDRTQPFRNEVSISEYERHKKDGTLMSNWKSMPATMIRKVALVQSLREAFPDEFGGIYSPEEMPIDTTIMPTYAKGQPPTIPPPQEPIQMPQEKKPNGDQPKEQGEIIVCLVDKVTQSEGKKKDGKEWVKYSVHIGEKKYSTFSKSYAEEAKQASQSAMKVRIEYKETTYGPEILHLQIEELPEPGSEG